MSSMSRWVAVIWWVIGTIIFSVVCLFFFLLYLGFMYGGELVVDRRVVGSIALLLIGVLLLCIWVGWRLSRLE